MNCRQVRDHLSMSYADSAPDLAELEKHLSRCHICDSEWPEVRSLITQLRSHRSVPTPKFLPTISVPTLELRAALSRPKYRRVGALVASLVGMLLIASASGLFESSSKPPHADEESVMTDTQAVDPIVRPLTRAGAGMVRTIVSYNRGTRTEIRLPHYAN
jgi:hypothetical protein